MSAVLDGMIAPDQSLQDAVAAYRAGRLDEAETLCRRILERQPDDTAGLQVLAAAAARNGKVHWGIELLEKAMRLRPHSSDLHVQLAAFLKLERRIPEAVASLRTALELQPDNAAAYNDLGLIHLEDAKSADALQCFDQAIRINPGLAISHFNKGVALEQLGDDTTAMASFREAASVDPDFAEAHLKCGNLTLSSGSRADAIAHFRRVATLKPESVLACISQAKLLMETGQVAAAEEMAQRAIGLNPRSGDAHSLLGTILMQLGRFLEAATCLEAALSPNRHDVNAYCQLALCKKLMPADRPLADRMEWLLGTQRLSESARGDCHFALGKVYDDLGEYEKAIGHYDRANAQRRRNVQFDRARHAAVVDGMIAGFTAAFFARNAALGDPWEVPVFILGMPRSGTTLVEQILSSHRDVAAGGELAFWGERVSGFRVTPAGDIDPSWVDQTSRDYRALLAGIAPAGRRITDKAPHNFHFIGLIHAVFPRARIIYCRRHPVDTCLSIYFQNFGRRMDFAYDREDLVCFYRQHQRLMAHWQKAVPADRLLQVDYEDLILDREEMTRRIIGFCALDWDSSCLRFERNQRAVQTASLWQARQPIYRTSVARWRHYEPWLGALRELLPDAEPGT